MTIRSGPVSVLEASIEVVIRRLADTPLVVWVKMIHTGPREIPVATTTAVPKTTAWAVDGVQHKKKGKQAIASTKS